MSTDIQHYTVILRGGDFSPSNQQWRDVFTRVDLFAPNSVEAVEEAGEVAFDWEVAPNYWFSTPEDASQEKNTLEEQGDKLTSLRRLEAHEVYPSRSPEQLH
ncbi:hypothetical protein [Kiloniella sp.]|uniref:hypothetical protein n=1 Tax=Kiloniella sp. TaxID=1938587 RepID=UPI003B013B0E